MLGFPEFQQEFDACNSSHGVAWVEFLKGVSIYDKR